LNVERRLDTNNRRRIKKANGGSVSNLDIMQSDRGDISPIFENNKNSLLMDRERVNKSMLNKMSLVALNESNMKKPRKIKLSKEHHFSKYCKPPEMPMHSEYEINLFGRNEKTERAIKANNWNYFGSKFENNKRDNSYEMNIITEHSPSSVDRKKVKIKPSLPPVLRTIKNIDQLTPRMDDISRLKQKLIRNESSVSSEETKMKLSPNKSSLSNNKKGSKVSFKRLSRDQSLDKIELNENFGKVPKYVKKFKRDKAFKIETEKQL
jgi:hypothetical protein